MCASSIKLKSKTLEAESKQKHRVLKADRSSPNCSKPKLCPIHLSAAHFVVPLVEGWPCAELLMQHRLTFPAKILQVHVELKFNKATEDINETKCINANKFKCWCIKTVKVVEYADARKEACPQCEAKVYRHINKASAQSWRFLFGVFITAAAAGLAVTLGLPLIEHDPQNSLPGRCETHQPD